LPEGKCYVSQAENRDDSGQKSNGGGKTSLIDILPVALLGKSIAGRDVKDCVNWNSKDKSFIVFVELINVEHNLNVSVKRTVYANSKSSELSILVNGKVPTTLPTKAGVEDGVDVRAGNEYILKELLDITEEDLFNYYIICGKKYKPFLQMGVEDKTQVISRFSNTTIVDNIIEKLEKEISDGEKEDQQLKVKISGAEGYIEAMLETISEEAEAKFNAQKQNELEGLQTRTGLIQKNMLEGSESVTELEARIKEIDSQFVDIDHNLYLEFEAERSSLNAHIRTVTDDFNELKKKAAKIETFLAGEIQCPKCKHWFHPKSDEKITKVDLNHVNFDIGQKEEELAQVERDKEALKDMGERVKVEMAKERANKDLHDKQQDLKRDIQSYQRQNERYAKELADIESRIQQVIAKEFQDEAAATLDKIEARENEIAEYNKTLAALVESIGYKQTWVERFYEFKFFLANKPLDQIVGLVNRYLGMNGSDLNLAIEGFKKLKNGKIKPDLRPIVYRNWTNPQNLAQFSAGEQCRLNVSVDLTFQQLINSSSKYGGLDLYLNDELVNGLDSLGISLAAHAFNQLGKTIILVSHSGSDMTYENTLTVVKENGISKLQE
jgi:chaperonin cofactor prefoldin